MLVCDRAAAWPWLRSSTASRPNQPPRIGPSRHRGILLIVCSPSLDQLIDEKLDMSQQCVLAGQKAKCAGLHQEKRGQQVKGSGSAPLLCSHETPLGVLHPALG